jgi:MOSC domain-containing protein YiiM
MAADSLVPSDVEGRLHDSSEERPSTSPGTSGFLCGIARKAYPGSPMEVIDYAFLSAAMGVTGDARGIVRNGKSKRQVSLMEMGDWRAALAEIGADVPWQERRANLLVDGLDLPQRAGAIIRIGGTARIETTMECDPCIRMEQVASGLMDALLPDWRGGVLGRVLDEGEIRVGDPIIIED